MSALKKKESSIDKRAEFLKGLKLLEGFSVVCEGEWNGKPIQARIQCAEGATLDSVIETVAGVKVRIFEEALRR